MSLAAFIRRGMPGTLATIMAATLAASAYGQAEPPAGDVPLVQPQPTPEPGAPAAEVPPPIVPAPDVPVDDPLVELPPPGEAPAGPAGPGVPLAPGGSAPFSFADLAEGLLDSVVYISTSQRLEVSRTNPRPDVPDPAPSDEFFEDFFNDEGQGGADPRTVQSLGSGFVIDPSGLIVTNNHVIADADEIVANFADGSKLTAEVVGVDDKTDLALLKVTAPKPLKATRFGRSDSLRVGDWVVAIGNPFGFGGTVTAGIVSALDRNINSGPYDHYIQTDASINRGNSGGPLFNLGGDVVGINTAIMSPTGGSIGIGFAVPSEIAVPVIQQLREFGAVRRGWIGVQIQDVTDEFAEGLGMERAAGALIGGLSKDGPAEKGGIQPGDIVTSFNGRPVDTMRDLPQIVADTPPGQVVDVKVFRDGKEVGLKVEVGLLKDAEVAAAADEDGGKQEGDRVEPEPGAPSLFGLTIGPVTDEARKTYSIESTVQGVLVTGVAPGSEAEQKSVRPGDVIVQVSQKDVGAPEEVGARIEELKAQGRRSVMFLVSGAQNKLRFVSLRFETE